MLSKQDQAVPDNGSARFFRDAYKGHPPWDIGHPQEVYKQLASSGQIRGSVLDIGCGTGENAIYLAGQGLEVWGVDFVHEAIERAQARAKEKGINVTFRVMNALHLDKLQRQFDNVIDSGLFHSLDEEERALFVQSLERVLVVGGRYFMLAFSDAEPGTWGPRRITQQEIRTTFQHGWAIESIQPRQFDTKWDNQGAKAWLAIIKRVY